MLDFRSMLRWVAVTLSGKRVLILQIEATAPDGVVYAPGVYVFDGTAYVRRGDLPRVE